jgi:hypothetical protein
MSMKPGRPTAFLLSLLLLLTLLGPQGAASQVLAVGGQASVNRDLGQDNTWGFGGRAQLSLPLTGITLQGTVDFYDPDCDSDDCDFREMSLNFLWTLSVPWVATPYLGAGLATQKSEGDWSLGDADDYGVNFLAGIVLKGPTFNRLHPFGEAKYQVMKDFDSQMVFSFGLLFSLF